MYMYYQEKRLTIMITAIIHGNKISKHFHNHTKYIARHTHAQRQKVKDKWACRHTEMHVNNISDQ